MKIRKIFYQFIALTKYLRAKYVYNKKINFIIKKNKCNSITANYRNKIKKEFSSNGINKVSTKWHRFYNSLNGGENVEFISELLFYTKIEPALNNSIMYPALEDKNLLDKFFDDTYLPKTVVKNINGFFYIDNNQVSLENAIIACINYDSLVIKPSIGTAGGKGVKKVELLKDKYNQMKTLFEEYKSNYVVQEILTQHPQLSLLNSTSLNTIRVITYMRQEEVIPLSSVIRIGNPGSFTDNLASGGIACGINDKGLLNDNAVNKYGEKYYSTGNDVKLKKFKIPCFDSIHTIVKEQHKNMPHFKLISWDIGINNKSEAIIIEFNAMGQDINLHQMCNGPLFGSHFKEILHISSQFNPLNQLIEYGG